MAQSQAVQDIPSSGRSETIDSTSTGRSSIGEGTPISGYIGLALAAAILVSMLFLMGMQAP